MAENRLLDSLHGIGLVQAQVPGVFLRRGRGRNHAHIERGRDEPAVMHIGSRQRNGTGHSIPVDLKMNFAAAASAIRGVTSQPRCFQASGLTNRCLHQAAVHRLPSPLKALKFVVFPRVQAEYLRDNTPGNPRLEVLVDRALRSVTGRQAVPLATRLEQIENPVQDQPKFQGLGATRLAPLERFQQRRHTFPKTIRHFRATHEISNTLPNKEILKYRGGQAQAVPDVLLTKSSLAPSCGTATFL